jgi:DNA-binding NtrC family response regulator
MDLELLRRRREDIGTLFAYFLGSGRERFRIEAGVMELMERHPRPGNVRELEHVTRVPGMLGGTQRVIRILTLLSGSLGIKPCYVKGGHLGQRCASRRYTSLKQLQRTCSKTVCHKTHIFGFKMG